LVFVKKQRDFQKTALHWKMLLEHCSSFYIHIKRKRTSLK